MSEFDMDDFNNEPVPAVNNKPQAPAVILKKEIANDGLAICLADFDLAGLTAKELISVGIDELNTSMLKACRAGAAFWAAQEVIKNQSTPGVLDSFEDGKIKSTPGVLDSFEGEQIQSTPGVLDNFTDWIEQNGLSKQRVYECIRIAKYYARLPETRRTQVLKIGKKQALLLAKMPQELIDQVADNGTDLLDEAETLSYQQLRDLLKMEQTKSQRKDADIEFKSALIEKMKHRDPKYIFTPQTHQVREECLAFQAECEVALNSLWALYDDICKEDIHAPEWRMRIEQIWVTAHVTAARAIDMLAKVKENMPIEGLPKMITTAHALTDTEAETWLLDYPIIERKHWAAQSEREKKREESRPKGPGRPRKD